MPEHSTRAHQRFAASAASRWFACPGSIRLCDDIPEQPPSKYAAEGTLAHEWLEYYIVGHAPPKGEATKEMIDGIVLVKEQIKQIPKPYYIYVESKVLVRALPETGGTADIAIYNSNLRRMWLIDYKFGAGVVVEAKNNKQLRVYDLGIMDTFGWQPEVIENVVVQPRAIHPQGPVRSETLSIADLYDFRLDLSAAVDACLDPDAPLAPGDEQCRWCPAKTICPAVEKRALQVVGETFSSIKQIEAGKLPNPKELTPDRIGWILNSKGLIEDWLQSVEDAGYSLAMSGTHIPGRKLVNSIGRRVWEGEKDVVAQKLSALTMNAENINHILPPAAFLEESLVGVTEAEKKVKDAKRDQGKQAVEEAMKQFAFLTTKKSNGKLQLVAESDSRPGVTPASQAFESVVVLEQI